VCFVHAAASKLFTDSVMFRRFANHRNIDSRFEIEKSGFGSQFRTSNQRFSLKLYSALAVRI
jgi:hypothetical protein